jgi:hypothetical protein
MRDEDVVRNKAVYLAIGVSPEGRRRLGDLNRAKRRGNVLAARDDGAQEPRCKRLSMAERFSGPLNSP